MAIIDSVKKLASKVGAETNGRTIAEQINNINRHLDSTGSRDIAEGVSKFADKEDGPSVPTELVYYSCGAYASGAYPGSPSSLDHSSQQFAVYNAKSDVVTIPKTVYTVGDGVDIAISKMLINGTINKLNITNYSYTVAFTFLAGDNFSGFTVKGNDVVPTGDSITAGKWYNALLQNDAITVEESSSAQSLGITILSE